MYRYIERLDFKTMKMLRCFYDWVITREGKRGRRLWLMLYCIADGLACGFFMAFNVYQETTQTFDAWEASDETRAWLELD